ncbi:hypothetical protein D3C81_1597710 [compost metagenome]
MAALGGSRLSWYLTSSRMVLNRLLTEVSVLCNSALLASTASSVSAGVTALQSLVMSSMAAASSRVFSCASAGSVSGRPRSARSSCCSTSGLAMFS